MLFQTLTQFTKDFCFIVHIYIDLITVFEIRCFSSIVLVYLKSYSRISIGDLLIN